MLGRPGFKSDLRPEGMISIFYYITSQKKKKKGAISLNFGLVDKWTDALSEANLFSVLVPVYPRMTAEQLQFYYYQFPPIEMSLISSVLLSYELLFVNIHSTQITLFFLIMIILEY